MRASWAAAIALLGPVAVVAALAGRAAPARATPPERNGFRLESRSIDVSEILPGGPPRDGIPALDRPPHTREPEAWHDDETVIGVTHGGEARAYPLSILVWHELVNDRLGGRPILVSYCPLCGTGMVFDRRVPPPAAPEGRAGEARRFGVSGLLYRSDLLMFDRETGSLWSQIAARAVTGPAEGARLPLVPSRMLPWWRWRERHPGTTVLRRDTGHRRDYGLYPYGDYASSERLVFPAPRDRRYHPKMPTLGVRLADGAARAYPADEVERAGEVRERFAGHPVRVRWRADEGVFDYDVPDALEAVAGYWFAWAAFHPDTSVFAAPPE